MVETKNFIEVQNEFLKEKIYELNGIVENKDNEIAKLKYDISILKEQCAINDLIIAEKSSLIKSYNEQVDRLLKQINECI